jgi:hypothetical protein
MPFNPMLALFGPWAAAPAPASAPSDLELLRREVDELKTSLRRRKR